MSFDPHLMHSSSCPHRFGSGILHTRHSSQAIEKFSRIIIASSFAVQFLGGFFWRLPSNSDGTKKGKNFAFKPCSSKTCHWLYHQPVTPRGFDSITAKHPGRRAKAYFISCDMILRARSDGQLLNSEPWKQCTGFPWPKADT